MRECCAAAAALREPLPAERLRVLRKTCRGARACGRVLRGGGEPGAAVLLRVLRGGGVRPVRRCAYVPWARRRGCCCAACWRLAASSPGSSVARARRALPLGGLHSIGAGEEPTKEREAPSDGKTLGSM